MARTVKLTPQEIAERDAAKRVATRKTGFDLMHVRDRGWAQLTNGVYIEWPTDPATRQDWVPYTNIPEGHFLVTIGGKKVLFSAEEFQRYLRWV